MDRLKRLLLLLLFAPLCAAQSTSVSAGPIVDTDGFAWANGTYRISFVPNPAYPGRYVWSGGNLQQNNLFTGVLNSSGTFSSVSIPDNTTITPSGSKWEFQVCPLATNGCVSVRQAVSGSTASLTSALNAVALGPRFQANPIAYGYGTIEVTPLPKPGAIFYDTTPSASPTCNQWTGSSWTSCGGGSGSVNPGLSGQGAYYAADGSVVSPTNAFTVTSGGQGSLNQGQTSTTMNVVNPSDVSTADTYQQFCTYNSGYEPVNPYATFFCTHFRMNITTPGWSLGNNGTAAQGWLVGGTRSTYLNAYSSGIMEKESGNTYHYGKGDTVWNGNYTFSYGGETATSDEGSVQNESQLFQLPVTAGTISAGATTGSTQITVTLTANSVFNEGAPLIDKTQGGTLTATLTGAGFDSTLNSNYYTGTGGAFTGHNSTAWGNIQPATCTGNGTGQYQAYVSTTCHVTLGSGSGNFTTSSDIVLSGPFFEEAAVTSVTSCGASCETLVFKTQKAWDNSNGNSNAALVMQGGLAGQAFVATSAISGWPIAYQAIGIAGGRFYFANCNLGQCNGPNTSNILGFVGVTFYPMAMISGTCGGTTNCANLSTNSVPFTNGDAVVSTPAAEYHYVMQRNFISHTTSSGCSDWVFSCETQIGPIVQDNGPAYSDALNQFINTAQYTAPALTETTTYGQFKYVHAYQYAPTHALFSVQNLYQGGGTTIPADYAIFEARNGYGVAGYFNYSPTSGGFSMSNTLTLQGLTVNGNAQVNGNMGAIQAGTSAIGGLANLVSNSAIMTGSGWTTVPGGGTATITGGQSDPFGGTNAISILSATNSGNVVYYNSGTTITATTSYQFCGYYKGASGGELYDVQISNLSPFLSMGLPNVTTSWKQYVSPIITTGGSVADPTYTIAFKPDTNSSQTMYFYGWNVVPAGTTCLTPGVPTGNSAQPTPLQESILQNSQLQGNSIASALGTAAEFSNGTCTTSKTIAPVNNRQNVTLTNGDTCALTFTQPSAGTFSIILKVIQSSVSTFNGTISGCKWPGGTVPTITATSAAVDFVSIYLDGSTAYCVASQNFQ